MALESLPRRRSAVGIAAAAVCALSALALPQHGHAQTAPGGQHAMAGPGSVAVAAALPDMADIAAQFAPSVVNISVSGTHKVSTTADDTGAADDDSGAPDADAMREFLRRFQQRFGGLPPEMQMPVRGEGSGFIVRADGVILINAHVVSDADEVVVKLTDRREFRAKVLGTDKLTDIAVLKIDANNLPAVSLAASQPLRVSEWVMAIGSPFGFESTVNADTLTVTANGTFRFGTELNAGSAYNVTILTQPVAQICQVANGTGSVDSGANSVDSVAIACVPTSSLGGTVSGLAPGTAVTLSNGSVLLPVATDGPFAFPGVLVTGASYQVSVATEPAGQTCAVTNATGVISATSQNAVTVTCS